MRDRKREERNLIKSHPAAWVKHLSNTHRVAVACVTEQHRVQTAVTYTNTEIKVEG